MRETPFSQVELNGLNLTSITQACGNSVDGQVYVAFDAFIRVSGAIAPDELYLQVIEWIQVWQTALDGLCQAWVGSKS